MIKIDIEPSTKALNRALEVFDFLTLYRFDRVTDLTELCNAAWSEYTAGRLTVGAYNDLHEAAARLDSQL